MDETRLWNVYVRTDNYQEREFTVSDTEENVRKAVLELRTWEHVMNAEFGVEYADLTAFGLKEEVGQWISNEY